MESYGTLAVYAYTSDARLPVVGAQVTVTAADGILAQEYTDRSGYTTAIRIPTPPPKKSQAPDEETPFATVSVTISHPDYEPEKALDVQVFPNVVTVQRFAMLPSNPLYPGQETEINTPAQAL